jgi:hypothetical protein
MKKKEYYHRLKQVEYLEQVNHRFEALRLAFIRFNEIWGKDSDLELDLNDYLTTMYPFPKSFDEFLVDFALWYGDGASKIVRAKHEIQPRLSIQEINNMVEEPEAEYDHHQDDDPSPSSWEAIAESRMKEIHRLRKLILLGQGFHATFVNSIRTEQTGGNIMVDAITLNHLPFIIGISDYCVTLYKSKDEFLGDENSMIANFDFPDVVEEERGVYSPQTSMFTIEQMRGTGQLNILDQINEVADTKRRLKGQPVIYWSDNQHGWFEVSYQDLVILNLHLIISGYSYRKGDKVYLEEDQDIVFFIKAIFGDSFGNDPAFHVWKSQVTEKYEEKIFIRKLKHYYR